ncbi:MAG TPA: type II toxin-antitoxin system HicB family antitoxin [Thermoanaerobaculia bacterium]
MKYRAYIEQDEDGVFVARVPSLPGCISQGQTRDEAQENIEEAIAAYLESLRKHGEAPGTDFGLSPPSPGRGEGDGRGGPGG